MEKVKFYKEILIIAILATVFVIITAAKMYVISYYNIGKGYEWESSAQTSTGLPIMFAKSNFYYKGYYENDCANNAMLYGDSLDIAVNSGSSGIGDDRQLYPNSLSILYYSFNENKFFEGKFKLDYDKISAVAEKMRKAVKTEKGYGTESIYFRAKVHPNGKIVFSMESYLSTSVDEVVIANFQATPKNYDWSAFCSNNSDDNRIDGKSTSVAIQRALLLNKYNWKIQVLLPRECDIKNLDVDVYGNKYLNMDTLKKAKLPTFDNFIYMPKKLSLSWQRKDTIEFVTWLSFNEEEIIKAFKTTNSKISDQPITMCLIVKDDTTAVKAILYGNGKSIELKNIEPSDIHSETIYHYPK